MKNTRPEAHVMKEMMMTHHDVPEDHIFMEDKACNTPENMIFSKRVSYYVLSPPSPSLFSLSFSPLPFLSPDSNNILDNLGVKKVILVTSDFHMDRAKLYAQVHISSSPSPSLSPSPCFSLSFLLFSFVFFAFMLISPRLSSHQQKALWCKQNQTTHQWMTSRNKKYKKKRNQLLT